MRTIVMTGASDGIGAAATEALAKDAGNRLVVLGRTEAKLQAVADRTGATPYVVDFADLAQVRDVAARLAADHERIDVLVNNAGAINNERRLTGDGFETTFQVNHLAGFLLTHLLLDRLAESRASVVTTSSDAASAGRLDLDDLQNERAYKPIKAYGDTKLANILFTSELQRRHGGRGLSAVAFHPGTVASNFASDTTSLWRVAYRTPARHLFLTSPAKAAERLTWLVGSQPGRDWEPGRFYIGRKTATPNKRADDAVLAAALWDRSLELLGLDVEA